MEYIQMCVFGVSAIVNPVKRSKNILYSSQTLKKTSQCVHSHPLPPVSVNVIWSFLVLYSLERENILMYFTPNSYRK